MRGVDGQGGCRLHTKHGRSGFYPGIVTEQAGRAAVYPPAGGRGAGRVAGKVEIEAASGRQFGVRPGVIPDVGVGAPAVIFAVENLSFQLSWYGVGPTLVDGFDQYRAIREFPRSLDLLNELRGPQRQAS